MGGALNRAGADFKFKDVPEQILRVNTNFWPYRGFGLPNFALSKEWPRRFKIHFMLSESICCDTAAIYILGKLISQFKRYKLCIGDGNSSMTLALL